MSACICVYFFCSLASLITCIRLLIKPSKSSELTGSMFIAPTSGCSSFVALVSASLLVLPLVLLLVLPQFLLQALLQALLLAFLLALLLARLRFCLRLCFSSRFRCRWFLFLLWWWRCWWPLIIKDLSRINRDDYNFALFGFSRFSLWLSNRLRFFLLFFLRQFLRWLCVCQNHSFYKIIKVEFICLIHPHLLRI